jgi:stress response protein YsnF
MTKTEEITIPLAEERLGVDKEVRELERVRIEKSTETRNVQIEEQLRRENVDIERTPVGQFVDEAPQIRTEGDVLIVPIVEEVMVKRLRVVEELRVTKTAAFEAFRQDAELRRTVVDVERHKDEV